MSRGMSLHTGYTIGSRYGPYVRYTVWHIQIRSTQILFGVLWWWRWRSGTRGYRGLDTTTPNSFYSKFANVTRARRTSPAPAYIIMCAQSLRTGARQRCACVFLVNNKFVDSGCKTLMLSWRVLCFDCLTNVLSLDARWSFEWPSLWWHSRKVNKFVVSFLNGIFALQILQMATFLLATVPSSLPGRPYCSHNTLFEVLLGTIHELEAAIFSTSLTSAWPTTMWGVTFHNSSSGSRNMCTLQCIDMLYCMHCRCIALQRIAIIIAIYQYMLQLQSKVGIYDYWC